MKPTWMLIALTAAILCVSCTRAENSSTLAPAGDQNTESPEVTPESVDETTSDEPETTGVTESADEGKGSTATAGGDDDDSTSEAPADDVTSDSGHATTDSDDVTDSGVTVTQKPDNSTETAEKSGDDKNCSHFDAASFIGGMVFMAGVLGLCLLGYKFYSSRQEGNYHNL